MKRRGALRTSSLAASLAWLTLVSASYAINVETVLVDNPGNAADATGYGAVGYEYHVGKYEITNAQYVDFLNAVDPDGVNALALYDSQMSSSPMGGIELSSGNGAGANYGVRPGHGDQPVVFVSWYDAIRMANWMNNGQGTADTETGAYTLGPLGADAAPVNGPGIVRNAGARWFLPSENEWYKAAYHQPFAQGGDGDDYWEYATGTNAIPYSTAPSGAATPDPANAANYFYDDLGAAVGYNDGFAVSGSYVYDSAINYLTEVGAYPESTSFYGTFDQNGNVSEWSEQPFAGGANREFRGGSWAATGLFGPMFLSAQHSNGLNPATSSSADIGFRLATIVPEPAAATLVASALTLLWVRRGTGSAGKGTGA